MQAQYCEVMCAMRAAASLMLGQVADAAEAVKGHVEAADVLAKVPWRIWVVAQVRACMQPCADADHGHGKQHETAPAAYLQSRALAEGGA